MVTLIKIILTLLFIVCLLEMPYGFYQLVRFLALIGFVILAYNSNEQGNKREAIIYVCLAILFQPFAKIALGRLLWNIIDLIVGIGLITSVFIRQSNNQN